MFSRTIAAGLLLFSIDAAHRPVAAETISVGTAQFPPYVIIDDADQASGPSIEFMNRLAKRAGVSFAYQPFPAKRVVLELLTNKLDILVTPLVPDYADKVITGDVFATIGVSLVWLKGTAPVTKLDELAGKNVAVIFGYSYLGARDRIAQFQPSPTLLEARDVETALKALEIGRANYFLVYTDSLSLASPETRARLEGAEHPLFSVDFRVMTSKNNIKGAALIQRLDDAYRQMPPNERFHLENRR